VIKYRPIGAACFEAALDADGWPLAITMHTTSNPYDRYLVPAGAYKNMVYEHSVVNLHELPYFFPTRYSEVHKLENHVPVGYRRSVGCCRGLSKWRVAREPNKFGFRPSQSATLPVILFEIA
jgi:hypothetical protein